jgi:hypothetical protein
MTVPNLYQPPSDTEIMTNQNSDSSLRLLAAQRSMYSKAKRYLATRLTGMFVIATAAPIIGGFWPGLAVTCGAVSGLWLFVGRTYLASRQTRLIDQAAAVQEAFDVAIFGMPPVRGRENMPSLEDITKLYDKAETRRQARLEKLRDWYPSTSALPATAVAICQRANVSYSDSLLRTTLRVWRICILAWAVIAVALCFWLDVTLEAALLIVLLPILPAFLDWLEFSRAYDTAAHVRRTTANEIEEAVSSGQSIDPSHLLIWQERIYELRRSTPLVPDVIYWASRKANERAMKSTATQLASKIIE